MNKPTIPLCNPMDFEKQIVTVPGRNSGIQSTDLEFVFLVLTLVQPVKDALVAEQVRSNLAMFFSSLLGCELN